MKRFLSIVVCVVLLVSMFSGCSKKLEQTLPSQTVQTDFHFEDGAEYKIGDVITLPIPKVDRSKVVHSYTVEVAADGKTIATLNEDDTAYRFTVGGEHTFTYRLVADTAIEMDSFTCNVEAGSSLLIDWLPAQVGRFDTLMMKPVVMKLDGKDVTADIKITDPDGEEVIPNNSQVSFRKAGEYRFVFTFQGENGEVLEETRLISAVLNTSDLFSFLSGGVSKEENVSAPEGMGEFNKDYQNFGCNQVEATGLKLTFNGTATIRFNNVIDLNEIPADASLIELFALPVTVPDYTGHVVGEALSPGDTKYPSGGYKHGTSNFTEFDIKLVDKYDPYNEVIIRYFTMPTLSYWNWNECYVAVGNSSILQAINASGSLSQRPAAYRDSGYITNFSFYGEGNNPFNVRVDYANKSFYTVTNGKEHMILDYDDAQRLGAANVWNGFTTGECYLELSFPSVTSDTSILITSVLGTPLSEVSPTDATPPHLTVDMLETELPVAQKGTSYSIPNAVAFDAITGACEVHVQVLDSNGTTVDVSDGKFTPNEIGTYLVSYSASDFYGNTVTRKYSVTVLEQVEDVTVKRADETPIFAGISIKEPKFEITGGSGNKEYSVEYYMDGQKIEAVGGWLTAPKVGTMEMRFTVTDHIRTYSKTIFQEVLASDTPVMDSVVLPQALYVGKAYAFPMAGAFDYKNQSVAQVRIAVNGLTLGSDRMYTPTQEDLNKGTLTVVYSAVANGKMSTKSYTMRVMEYAASSSAIVEGNGISTEYADRYCTITSNTNFRIPFAYAVAAEQFQISFGGVYGADNFSTIAITLRDSKDINKVVTVKLLKQADNKFAVTIGGTTETVNAPWITYNNDNQATLVVAYSGGSIILKDGNEVLYGSFPLTVWDNGLAFDGFSSGGVYGSAEFSGVVGLTTVRLYGFSGQSYNRFNIFADAQVAFAESFESAVVSKGTEVKIPVAFGYSPVSYQISTSYEVIAPDGSIIKSGSGLDGGAFVCDQYGQYKVVWSIIDEVNNKSAVKEISFKVYDRTAPEVQVDTTPIAGKVDEKMNLSTAKVADNLDGSDCVLRVFVVDTHNKSVDVTETMSYTPAKAGHYQVVYMAMDKSGNISVVTVDVTVEKGDK